jgi:hypothetical protein
MGQNKDHPDVAVDYNNLVGLLKAEGTGTVIFDF